MNTLLPFPGLRYNTVRTQTRHPDDKVGRPGPDRVVERVEKLWL
jgi:hypothetical protein